MAVSICGAKPVEVFLEKLVLALVRWSVHVAAGRALLVGSEQQAAVFLAHVPGRVCFAQHAHFRQALGLAFPDGGMRFGDDVLVLDRDDRNIEADHGTRLAGKVAGTRDHVLAGDLALVGLDDPLAVGTSVRCRSRPCCDRSRRPGCAHPWPCAWVRSAGWI
jgi:hypothetical protein